MKIPIIVLLLIGLACRPSLTIFQGSEILRGFEEIALRLLTANGLSMETTRQKLHAMSKYDPDASSYFDVFPDYMGKLSMNSPLELTGKGFCFQEISLSTRMLEDDRLEVHVHLANADSLLCTEAIIFATDSQFFVKDFLLGGSHVVTFDAPQTPAEKWDLHERGPRVFLFRQGLSEALQNLASTLYLFEPCVTEGVGDSFAQSNLNFLRDNVGIEMPLRDPDTPEIMPIDKNLIKNGDTFDIMRLDGLDPMIAWAMGASTGHTAIALWEAEELFICEANAKSPYWPVNGIQCNTYEDWMEFGRRNGYNVVWAPLDRSLDFDVQAAWTFVNEHLGIDYGWEVVLTGVLDTLHGNQICLDTAKTRCIVNEHFEFIFSIAEKYSKDAARLFKPAIMQRSGVNFDLPMIEGYYNAFMTKGIQPETLHLLPELDSWKYPTTKNEDPIVSDVSICHVFTCKVLRAAGIFDADLDFNCAELNVNDNYRLKIYETNFTRPEVCIQWDPNNPLCQMLGKYQLRLDTQPGQLPRYNYVDLYSGFANECPSMAPDYLHPENC